MKALLGKKDFIALTVMHNSHVVAGLVAYELTKFGQERKEIYVYDLAVDAPYRRKGLATGLIHELKHMATERGAWVIYVQADKKDVPAVRLYESLGTRKDVYHFDIQPL